jgi:gamma-carbonic anhydrase
MILLYEKKRPKIGDNVFIAQGARLIGEVYIGDDSSIFFNSVLRGDINSITIGERTNIQDNCTIHVASDKPVIVGDDVTVGHNVVIHACEIGDNVTIGMSTTIMNGAVVGNNSVVAAGSLITRNKIFPAGVLILGNPAKMVRALTEDEIAGNRNMAIKYKGVKDRYLLDEKEEEDRFPA